MIKNSYKKLFSIYITYNCVNEHRDKSKFRQDFIMFRSQESLFREIRRGQGAPWILILLVKTS